MQWDRQEKFVMELLSEVYGVKVNKLRSLFDMRRANVVYEFERPYVVTCLVTPTDRYYYDARCNELDMNQFTERMGRMIGFAKTVLAWYNNHAESQNHVHVSGDELERLLRNHRGRKVKNG